MTQTDQHTDLLKTMKPCFGTRRRASFQTIVAVFLDCKLRTACRTSKDVRQYRQPFFSAVSTHPTGVLAELSSWQLENSSTACQDADGVRRGVEARPDTIEDRQADRPGCSTAGMAFNGGATPVWAG